MCDETLRHKDALIPTSIKPCTLNQARASNKLIIALAPEASKMDTQFPVRVLFNHIKPFLSLVFLHAPLQHSFHNVFRSCWLNRSRSEAYCGALSGRSTVPPRSLHCLSTVPPMSDSFLPPLSLPRPSLFGCCGSFCRAFDGRSNPKNIPTVRPGLRA